MTRHREVTANKLMKKTNLSGFSNIFFNLEICSLINELMPLEGFKGGLFEKIGQNRHVSMYLKF